MRADGSAVTVNRLWRGLFGVHAHRQTAGGAPEAVVVALRRLASSQETIDLGEIELVAPAAIGFGRFAIVPVTRSSEGDEAVIVVCVDATKEVIGRRLSVSADAIMWTGNSSGSIERANDAWYLYTGAVSAPSWIEFVHADDRPRCLQAMSDAVRSKVAVTTSARLHQRSTAYRWHDVHFLATSPSRCLAAAVDIHETRVRVETIAPEAIALSDGFIAAVSHELRAPLTTMLLWSKVLRDDTASADLKRNAVDAIYQSAVVQSRVVGDLLDVTRASKGKLFVDLRPVELTRLVRDVVEAITPAMTAKGLVVDVALDLSECFIEGDAIRLAQVFDNILSNALKFSDAPGCIHVSAHRRRGAVDVVISDSGRGISPEFLPHVFDMFSQLEDGLTRKQGGLGLGLAIARELIALHHGSIRAASPGINLGATFTITLPRVRKRRASTPLPRPECSALQHLSILVIDDDVRVRSALDVLLRRAGACVYSAESADVARDVLQKQKVDVLICDIAMPGEDGYTFVRALRDQGYDGPAIALTAYATAADARSAHDAGFDLHVPKPVDFDGLVASVHATIEARASRSGSDSRIT